MSSSDRIEKRALLRAPRPRVWQALTQASQFGAWFRAEFAGEFAEGRHVSGKITHPGYERLRIEVFIERMEAERVFAFRWHPHAVDPKHDYSTEPMTRVEFRLEEAPEGTLLTVVESGFDALPAERRELAFRMNSEGWSAQLENVRNHVEG